MGRLRGVLVLAVLAGLAGAAYWYWSRPQVLPEPVLAAQRALASDDAILLASLDLRDLASLETGDSGLLAEAERQLASHPMSALDWRADATHLVAALYRTGAGLSTAVVLVGSFDPAAVAASLTEDERFELAEARIGRERAWSVARVDPDRCGAANDWFLHASTEHVAIGGSKALAGFLSGAGDVDVSALSEPRLAGALVFPARSGEHPVIAALRSELSDAVGEIDGPVRIGLSASAISGDVGLEIEFATADAESVALRWSAGADPMLSAIAPTLAAWRGGLSADAHSGRVRAEGGIAGEAFASAFRIPDELLVLASRSDTWAGSDEDAQALDPRPRRFRSEYPLSALPRYDRQQALAGPGDVIAGPFGLQVRAVRRAPIAGTGADALEIEIEADAPVLANLGESSPPPRLAVTSVLAEDGSELLAAEPCGPDRNGRPAEMSVDPTGDWMRARKTVRIDPGATLDGIASVAGHVEMSLPVRTESQDLEARVGAAAERDGVRVEITGVSRGSFSYRVSGEAARALDVRGLGAFSRALPVSASWTQRLLFDHGRVGTRSLRGELEGIEVIFAAEERTPRYAFRFDSARPGTDREETATQSARFVEYTPEQYAQEFAPRFGVPFDTAPAPRARTTAGPFTLALRQERRAEEETRRLHVLAPDIPNLSYNLTALELRWDEHSVPLRPRYRFGREELTCAVDLDALGPEQSRMSGELLLRLASDVEAMRLEALEPGRSVENRGVQLRVTELGRDRFSAQVEGDVTRLVAVEALNADGQALLVEPLEAVPTERGMLRSFRVHGQATQLDVQVAGSFEPMRYPFELDWTPEVPAAPAP